MSEHDEQTALFQALAYLPAAKWVFAIPNGGLRNMQVAIKLKAEGAKRGVWDIFVPVARGGHHGLFIEMKFGKNKLTAEQTEFRQFVEEQGYCCKVFYD